MYVRGYLQGSENGRVGTIVHLVSKWMIENTEGAIQNGKSREYANIWYTKRRKTTQYVLDTTIRKQTQVT